MATIADYFDGKVDQSEYVQALAKEAGHLWRGTMTSKRFTFTGVPTSIINNLPENVSVTDIGGTSYTIPLRAKFTDGSSGYAIFPAEEVKVTKSRMSYHMWQLTVEWLTGVLS